jgi:alpha-beta hydrolase superfamily lysophospholipase
MPVRRRPIPAEASTAARARPPAPVSLRAEELYFKSGATRLFFRTWECPTSRATVVLVHGLGEHCGRHDRFASALRERNFSVVAYDLRGHGRSAGRRGHVERFEEHVDDLGILWRVVEDQGRPGPRFLFGHSLGGLVALHFVLHRPPADLAGMVLSAPALKPRVAPGLGQLRLARLLNRIAPALPLPNAIRPEDLTHDRGIIAQYRRDRLVHRWTTPRAFLEILRAMQEARDRAPEIRLPLLVVGSDEDPIVSSEAIRELARLAGSEDKRFFMYPRLYHEVFNETDPTAAVNEVVSWLEARSA